MKESMMFDPVRTESVIDITQPAAYNAADIPICIEKNNNYLSLKAKVVYYAGRHHYFKYIYLLNLQ